MHQVRLLELEYYTQAYVIILYTQINTVIRLIANLVRGPLHTYLMCCTEFTFSLSLELCPRRL